MMKVFEYFINPKKILYTLGMKGKLGFIKDDLYLKLMYWSNTGKKLNLENPKTYNEKLQWLKLHNTNSEYSIMVDKYEAKKYAASIIGEKYIIPTLGVWDSFDDINFATLPEKFVLKCTHDSGGIVICKDKTKLNYEEAKRIINRSLKRNYYVVGREYPYKDIKPRIIAEQYLEEPDSQNENYLTDYKFFCFNGEPKIIYISKDKSKNPTTDFFDMDFNYLPIKMRDNNSPVLPKKPKQFMLMKELARKLSIDKKHVRVDFYCIEDDVYFGELTFFHNGGFSVVEPEEWNIKMGSWIKL